MSKMEKQLDGKGTGHVPSVSNEEEEVILGTEGMGREWFAITAFPLFAGTFGPIATALNVCALVQPWRCEYASTGIQSDAKDILDPTWLLGMNIISLVFGVIANFAIMFVGGRKGSHAARHSFYLVLVTIVGGSLASIILIVLVITAAMTLQLASPPDHAFTEAFYYAIMAASLYAITSVFIVYTAYMLWETLKTSEGRKELSKQFASQHRSLKMLTILFLAYLLLGARAFAKIEGWRYLDAVFWADVTILTVGFGDFKPATHLGKSLLIPYALFGIFILFLVVYCITQVIFEPGKSMWEVHIRDQKRLRSIRKREGRRQSLSGSQLQDMSFSEVNNNSAESSTPHEAAILGHNVRGGQLATEKAARERDFDTMRSILMQAKRHRIFYSMLLWLGFAVFLWFFGALLFYLCERDQNWTYFTSIYFTFISLLAIGYGDKTLESMAGKAVFVLWSLIVVPTLTMLITTGTEAIGVPYLSNMQEYFRKTVLRREVSAGGTMKKKVSHTYKSPLSKGIQPTHNNHDKNHLRIRAIKSIARDHMQHQSSNTQPDYTFEDWEYMLYLMDILEPVLEDESRPSSTSWQSSKRHGYEYGQRGEKGKVKRTVMQEWQDGRRVPDWLHGMNPLNVEMPLTQWMLEALTEKLESELAELRRKEGNTKLFD